MKDQQRKAIAQLASDIGAALEKFSRTFYPPGCTPDGSWTRADQSLPWSERILRQSLIIKEILDRGGRVPRTLWLEIAAKYGYSGHGVSGFFRSGTDGLLELRNDVVRVTKRGRERLAQNQDRVNEVLGGLDS